MNAKRRTMAELIAVASTQTLEQRRENSKVAKEFLKEFTCSNCQSRNLKLAIDGNSAAASQLIACASNMSLLRDTLEQLTILCKGCRSPVSNSLNFKFWENKLETK